MTLLDRYFGKRVLSTFFKTVLALIALFILIDLLTTRRNQIVKNDIPWGIVAAYYAVSTPGLMLKYQIGALSVLISTLLVFGNAAQANEITAALAGGISLGRLTRVPVLVAAGLAILMFFMQETIGVVAGRRMEELNARYFSLKDQSERPGISWTRLNGKWTCHITKFNRKALTGEDVFIHSRARGGGTLEQIDARRIFWEPDTRQWMLEDGVWSVMTPSSEWDNTETRISQQPAPFTVSPEEIFAFEQPPETKTAANLLQDIHRGERYGMPVSSAWTDFHAKFSQPALCFVMIWLAIPFAMRVRRGGLAIGFGISIVIALAYLILFQISMGLGHIDRLSPLIAAWLADMVFLAVGIVLFHRTAT